MKSWRPTPGQIAKASTLHRRTVGYTPTARTPERTAERHTPQGEAQDIHGKANPQGIERVTPEDMTLIGGFVREEVLDAVRTGRAANEAVAEAARLYSTPWLLECSPLPNE